MGNSVILQKRTIMIGTSYSGDAVPIIIYLDSMMVTDDHDDHDLMTWIFQFRLGKHDGYQMMYKNACYDMILNLLLSNS